MSFTGDVCPESGDWESNCQHRTRYPIRKGDAFPPCGQCGRAVIWTLVRPEQPVA